MRITYETGRASLIQFIAIAFLNIINTIVSIVTTCLHNQSSDCVANALTSVVYYLLIIIWFGFLLALGLAAQTKRSRRLCQALIAGEAAVFIVAGYNIKLGITYHSNVLGLITSFIDFVLAFWIMTLAFRLMRAGGGRVLAPRHRARQRLHSEE